MGKNIGVEVKSRANKVLVGSTMVYTAESKLDTAKTQLDRERSENIIRKYD